MVAPPHSSRRRSDWGWVGCGSVGGVMFSPSAPMDGVLQLDLVEKELMHEHVTVDTRDHEDHTFCGACTPPPSALLPTLLPPTPPRPRSAATHWLTSRHPYRY